ncbi:MAG: hypothetical protein R3D26_12180 [Cyanobacteriota/Melainabacteria group bacterium]
MAEPTKEYLFPEPAVKGPGLDKLALVLNGSWWSRTWNFIWTFRKQSFKPALFCLIGECCMWLSLYLGFASIVERSASGEPITDVYELLGMLGQGLLMMFVFGGSALIFVCLGVGLWIVVLTGFCRAYLQEPAQNETPPENLSENLSKNLEDRQREAVEFVKGRKLFLLLVWIFYSLIMFIPATVFFTAFILIYFSIPGALPVPPPFSQEVTTTAWVVGVITAIILLNHFLIAMPLSSLSYRSSRKVALDSFFMTFKTLPAISIFSILFILFCLFYLSGEFALSAFNSMNPSAANYYGQLFFLLLNAAFHAAISIVIWPLVLALPCELLRGEKSQ